MTVTGRLSFLMKNNTVYEQVKVNAKVKDIPAHYRHLIRVSVEALGSLQRLH